MPKYLISETQIVLVYWTVEAETEEQARERFMSDHETLTEISREIQDSQGLTITAQKSDATTSADEPDADIVIWPLPYDADAAPEALGYYTLAEACELLRKPDAEIEWALNHAGFIDANGYHAERND
ncbi:hypothetical protein [EBPR siphovirus 5]|nr:hypothetical protein [EBPR siphovirus 5]